MRCSPASCSKRALKYGGKSGVLPEVRPIFKHNPIRPKTQHELQEESQIPQGYAEGVPVPQRKGMTFHRQPVEKPVVSVEERIQKMLSRTEHTKDKSEMTEQELWAAQREELRKQHLREAYEAEAQRLERIAALEAKKRDAESQKKAGQTYKTSEATKQTLPTIDSYLKGPIMRQRTPEEQAIVEERRLLNRKTKELEVKNAKTTDLLELYHSAANFITTEEELKDAIHQAFEIKVGRFESSERLIEDKLFGYASSFANSKASERLIKDAAYGEIDGQPGLEAIKDTLSGEAELLRRQAQAKLNN